MHNSSSEGNITQLHKQHTVLEKETNSKSMRKGAVYWVLPKSIFKNKMLAVVKEDGCLPDLFPLFIPFPATECVLLMQFHQRRVLQKDSANQKCLIFFIFASHEHAQEVRVPSHSLLSLRYCVPGMDGTIGERSFEYIGPVVWNAFPLSVRHSSSLS